MATHFHRELTIEQVVSAFLLVLGSAVLVAAVIDLRRGLLSRAWTAQRAQIVEAELKQGHGHVVTYYANLRYRYDVAGRSYENTTIMYDGVRLGLPRKAVEQFLAGLTPGQAITIYVSPSHPQLSTAIPGVPRRIWQAFFMAGMLLLGALGTLSSWLH